MKIYLVGMPYSGKSTLAKQVAAELFVPYVDLDNEVEKREGKSISQIFSEEGEDHFRLVESIMLKEWAATTGSFVMATGGGAPCFYQGMEAINQTGLSIFLDVSVEELVRRVGEKTDRPLLQVADKEALTEKLTLIRAKRLDVYREASIQLYNPEITTLLHSINLKK